MDDASAVDFTKGARKTDSEPEKEAQLDGGFRGPPPNSRAGCRLFKESGEWLALLVLENERRTTLVVRKDEGSQRPRRFEIAPQGHFVFQHPDVSGRRMLRYGYRDED